jgi:hypothetical protein
MLLDTPSLKPDVENDAHKSGWSRPIYALRNGLEILLGHLEREGNQFALLSGDAQGRMNAAFRLNEFSLLSRVAGVAVPI